jgi:hypothetical protein
MATATAYEAYVERKLAEHGSLFRRPAGSPDLVSAFNDGARYEVDVYGDGEVVERGRVSVTTGWAPSFLLMHRRNALGSSTLLDARSRIIHKTA